MIRLYSDGSCHHTDEVGAYCAIVSTPTLSHVLWGVKCPTTIGRMELEPIIEGMRWVLHNVFHGRRGGSLHVISDSESTVKTASGLNDPKSNMDLWEAFYELKSQFNVTCEWRARNSCIPLDICDSIAGNLRTYGVSNIHKAVQEVSLDFNYEL